MPTLATRPGLIALFVVLALAASWLRMLGTVAPDLAGTPAEGVAMLIAAFSPLLVALLVTSRRIGGPGVGAFLRRGLRFGIGAGWYAAALIGPILLAAISLGVSVALGVPVPQLALAVALDAALLFALAALFAIGEEFGWRGYLQAALQRSMPALAAALMVAVVAALWHAPHFLTPAHVISGIPAAALIAWIGGFTMLLAALYNSTGGSIPAVVVGHAAINATVGLIAEQHMPDAADLALFMWVAAAVAWGLAAVIVLWLGPRTMSTRTRERAIAANPP